MFEPYQCNLFMSFFFIFLTSEVCSLHTTVLYSPEFTAVTNQNLVYIAHKKFLWWLFQNQPIIPGHKISCWLLKSAVPEGNVSRQTISKTDLTNKLTSPHRQQSSARPNITISLLFHDFRPKITNKWLLQDWKCLFWISFLCQSFVTYMNPGYIIFLPLHLMSPKVL